MAAVELNVLIIGDGQAATPLALDLARAGKTVGVAERKFAGGSCVNFGCTPTKAAIASAKLVYDARRASEFGLRIPKFKVDFNAVLDSAREIVKESRQGLVQELDKRNPRYIRGHARLTGRHNGRYKVLVEQQEISCESVVLDTGTRALIPPIEGLDQIDFITADNWVDLKLLPKKLAIIGGGVIALEMAQFFRRLGSEVTIIEAGPRIAATEDSDVAAALQVCLESEGIKFHASAKIVRVAKSNGGIRVEMEKGPAIRCLDLFVATGRRPNTADLGLDTVGVKVDDKGMVVVDKHLKTTAEHVYAAGDIRGGPQFTHTAWDDYRIIASQLIGDGRRTTERIVPYAIFTDPEIGRVGMNETQARKEGKTYRLGRYEMRHDGMARERRETRGFVKVLVDDASDQILGATILAADAGNMIQIFVDLMNAKASYKALADAVVIHPTYSEASQSAAQSVAGYSFN